MNDDKPIIATRDNVAADLLQIIEDSKNHHFDIDEDLLMQKLCSYIVRRDHKVHNHAYNLGKEHEKAKDNQKAK